MSSSLRVDGVLFVHPLHEQESKPEGHHAHENEPNRTKQCVFKRIGKQKCGHDGTVAAQSTAPTSIVFFSKALNANDDQIDRHQEVGDGLKVDIVEGDKDADNGVGHASNAKSVHEGKEDFIGFPGNRFPIVDQIIFGRQQRQDDALNGQGHACDGGSLVLGSNLALHHDVDDAEGHQNGQQEHAVDLSVFQR